MTAVSCGCPPQVGLCVSPKQAAPSCPISQTLSPWSHTPQLLWLLFLSVLPCCCCSSRQWSPLCPALLEKGELVTTVWFILFCLCLSSRFLSWSPTLQENRQWWICLRKLKRADVKPDSSGYCSERYQKEFWGNIDLEKAGHCQLPPWSQLGSRNSRAVCFALSLQEQVLDMFWETSSGN